MHHIGETRVAATLAAISDVASCKVLIATIRLAKSAHQISEECSLPLSSIYKILPRLIASDLLQVQQIKWNENRRQTKFYRSTFGSLDLHLDSKGLKANMDKL
jgi:hypothetical protein